MPTTIAATTATAMSVITMADMSTSKALGSRRSRGRVGGVRRPRGRRRDRGRDGQQAQLIVPQQLDDRAAQPDEDAEPPRIARAILDRVARQQGTNHG